MPESGKFPVRNPPPAPEPPLLECAVADEEEPPGSPKRHPKWKDVPLDQWEDWKWQMQNSIRTTAQIVELLPFSPAERQVLEKLEGMYKVVVPPYYFSLINLQDPADPIRLQSIPSPLELTPSSVELDDPLEEDSDSPVPGLTHRYPDRALVLTTPACSMYCRFCTRKRVTLDRGGWDGPSHDEERIIDYLRAHREVRDVIVSGGDPLMLPPKKLKWFVDELTAIKHVDVIRIGTRCPVTLPQKLFDRDLIGMLQESGKVWVQTHFNHPAEITPEAARGCRNLVNAGIPINNHAVLLKGVNDSVAVMRQLLRGLLRIKVRPYYLFHCDPVVGAGHFRTSVWKGLEIMEGLRGHMSGLAVPTYVVDGLHGAGKIPLMPNYMVSASENAVILRNYEGLLFRYAPEDKATGSPEGLATIGVSNLLSGNGSALVPEGNRRYARRRKIQKDRDQQAAESVGRASAPNPKAGKPRAAARPAAPAAEPVAVSHILPILDDPGFLTAGGPVEEAGVVVGGPLRIEDLDESNASAGPLPVNSALAGGTMSAGGSAGGHGVVGGGTGTGARVPSPAPEIPPPVAGSSVLGGSHASRGGLAPELHRRRRSLS